MRTLVLKYTTLFTAILAAYLLVMYFGTQTLDSDRNFQKLTSPKGNSLIIGTSRAARLKGDEILGKFHGETSPSDSMLNYAFNLSVSPFGEYYNESIRRVCQGVPSSGDRTFVIAVDPWALSESKTESKSPESDTYITFDRNSSFPAIQYLFSFNDKPLISFFSNINEHKGEHLKNMSKSDTNAIRKHTAAKIKFYRENHYKLDTLSKSRIEKLSGLIQYLEQLGGVYLVRIPVSEEMESLEHSYAPNFLDELVIDSTMAHTPLLDFYPIAEEYICFDGNHLFEEDAIALSKEIGAIIQWHKKMGSSQNKDLVKAFRASRDSRD